MASWMNVQGSSSRISYSITSSTSVAIDVISFLLNASGGGVLCSLQIVRIQTPIQLKQCWENSSALLFMTSLSVSKNFSFLWYFPNRWCGTSNKRSFFEKKAHHVDYILAETPAVESFPPEIGKAIIVSNLRGVLPVEHFLTA